MDSLKSVTSIVQNCLNNKKIIIELNQITEVITIRLRNVILEATSRRHTFYDT